MTTTAGRPADSTVSVGVAQRPGTQPPCADGADVQRCGERVSAAVVDGAGHHQDVVRHATVVPPVITHTGIALGGLAALITAGQPAAAAQTRAGSGALHHRPATPAAHSRGGRSPCVT